ncbi:MAG: PilC/PilY family type IV pilus protein [Myxococcota bacterium]
MHAAHSIPTRRLFLTATLATALFLGAAFPTAAGDEDIFSSQIAPNVVLMVDNSGSMNAVMEHPSFDAASFTATCDVLPAGGAGFSWVTDDNGDWLLQHCWPNQCVFMTWSGLADWQATSDPSDHPQSGYVERTFCGQTRRLYNDGENESYGNYTWYGPEYTEFLYSIDAGDNVTTWGPAGEARTAPQIVAEIDDATNGTRYIDGQTFPKYQITRITAARDIARDVIYQTNSDCPAFLGDCGVYEDRVRFGIAQFHAASHGGFVNAPVDAYSANRTDLDAAITSLDAQTSTPLSETLFKLWTYFMPRDASDLPTGADGATSFPAYSYDTSTGDYASSSSDRPDDPVIEACQKNFVIMITDGEPTADDFSTSGSETQGFSDFDDLVGDYAPDAAGDPDVGPLPNPEEGSPPWTFASGTGYLDDIALLMQETDCRPDFPEETNVVDVYTVGFTTAGPVNSLLEKTAANGNGLYFNGNQAELLTEALVSSVQDIISKSQGFSAATVPAARTSDGGNLYTTLFQPTSTRPFWPGLLRSYEITVAGEILDRNGNCALEDLADPNFCASGTFKSEAEAPPYWNASKAMPGANGRNLLVSLPGASGQNVVTFDHAVTEADLGGALGSVSEYPPAAGVASAADLDEAVVAFVAGCEWGTGLTSGGGEDFSGCIDRTRVENGSTVPDRLGDIFHSNPVVVGPPRSFYEEASYQVFASDPNHATRDRVIIAGANDGFLHGFHAGAWDVGLGGYDAGTGVEVFAFMPWSARATVMDLAKDDATLHPLNVDGSPAVADVWIDSNADVDDAKLPGEWKTLLVTGMREGGEQYLALDVTDPGAANYPGYAWEFPLESDTTWRDYVGQTWSQPVITRVRLERSNGDVEERWVAIAGMGYDPTSDVNDTARYDATSLKGRGLVMIDVETGRPVAARKFGSATGDLADMLYAIPSSPAVLDYDGDGFADVIYVGDVGGNVWKWVIREPGIADPSDAELYQPDWSFRKFFDHDPSESDTAHARSFYFAPSATLVSGILHLGFGSGERNDLNCSSGLRGCDVPNRFYVVKDRDVWDSGTLATIDGRASTTGDLTDLTTAEASCPAVAPEGFFFEVADGEKFVTNSEVFNSFFFTSTFKPDLSNACEPSGLSTLYGFLARCGQGFFGPPSPTSPIAGTSRTLDLGQGMPTDARLSIAPGDGGNRLIISKQDGQIVNIESGASDSEHGLLYWREAP